MNIIRELAPNEAAYRSISRSWLEFSPLLRVLKTLSQRNVKNLNYDESSKFLFTVRKPEEAFLPKSNVSSTYVFSMEDYFFAYPNNYNYYVNYYKDTFQHGGVSMEEMIIPIISLNSKYGK